MNGLIEKLKAEEIPAPQVIFWEDNLKKYARENNLEFKKDAFYLLKTENIPTPDNTALILVRIALSDLEGKSNKYVMLQTYYDEGNLSTIDIVRLPKNYHKEIVHEYLERILTNELSRQVLPLQKGYSRFLVAGGYVDYVDFENNKVKFHGSSRDFSNKFSTYNVNDIASYLVSESGLLDVDSGSIEKGKEYIGKCLDIMQKYKLKPEFYSQLVDLYHLKNIRESEEISGHILYALILMKSIDKAIQQGKSIMQVLTQEIVEGIGREIMLKGIAEKIKIKKNE